MHQDIPSYPPSTPRTADSLIQVIASKLDNLHSDVSDLKDVKAGNVEAIASCLGHALRTGSYRHMKNLLKEFA